MYLRTSLSPASRTRAQVKPLELYRALMMFNLTSIRGKTLQKLAAICDKNGDGTVAFSEVRAE